MVIFASPAQAHHPTTTASPTCIDDQTVINYTSTSWQIGEPGHPDVRIQVSVNGGSWTEVDSGAYEAPSYSFSGSFPGEDYVGQSIRVRSRVVGNWPNGAAPGNSHPAATTAAFTVPADCTPPPPSGWACVGGEVVFIEDATDFEGTLYDTQGEALEDPACQDVAASTTFTIGGDCALGEAGAAFTISGNLGEGLTLTVAGQTVDSTGAFSIAVGGAGSYDYEVSLDDGFVLAEGSPSSEGAIVIEDCTPPPPPSGWVCEAGEAVFLADTTGFEGTVYDSQAEALEDPDCQDVMAATTFTIGGTCALVGDEASFTISGSLGEGLTLTVAGETITTSPFSVDVSAAGSYPYSVTLDEGFELAVGSPAASGTILIQDCTSDDEVDDVDELPFTGIDPGVLALASMALLGTGTMMLRSSRKLEES